MSRASTGLTLRTILFLSCPSILLFFRLSRQAYTGLLDKTQDEILLTPLFKLLGGWRVEKGRGRLQKRTKSMAPCSLLSVSHWMTVERQCTVCHFQLPFFQPSSSCLVSTILHLDRHCCCLGCVDLSHSLASSGQLCMPHSIH